MIESIRRKTSRKPSQELKVVQQMIIPQEPFDIPYLRGKIHRFATFTDKSKTTRYVDLNKLWPVLRPSFTTYWPASSLTLSQNLKQAGSNSFPNGAAVITYLQRWSSAADVSNSFTRGAPASVLLNNISYFPLHLFHFGVMFVGSDLKFGFSAIVKSVKACPKASMNAWLLYGGGPLF
jgi:hypothetical protein